MQLLFGEHAQVLKDTGERIEHVLRRTEDFTDHHNTEEAAIEVVATTGHCSFLSLQVSHIAGKARGQIFKYIPRSSKGRNPTMPILSCP